MLIKIIIIIIRVVASFLLLIFHDDVWRCLRDAVGCLIIALLEIHS